MNKTPSPFSGWPAWLLFLISLVAVAPPSVTFVAFLPTLTHNPWLAWVLFLFYELLVGFMTILIAFLRKIWDRRVDAWADASAGRLETMFYLLFAGAHRRYCAFFCYEHGDLDMKGISTRGTYTLGLEQVFIEVRIDSTPIHQASSNPIHLPSDLRSGTHDIWDYLARLNEHLVILGAPGSGKTTLLKHLGLCLIQDRHRRKTRTRKFPWTVPLFLPLREHSSLLKEQPAYSLVDAATFQMSKWKQPIPSLWIKHLLQKGRCLVLLDGLDEIADTAQRQQMVDWVQSQMLAYSTNRFVVTSRPLGYRSNPLERVTVLNVQPFTIEQVTHFLRAWYLANEIKRAVRDDPGVRMKAREGAEDLLKRLHTTPALFALAVNPLLLTMIATVHLYYGTLPGARITLYKAICEVFFSRRHEVSNSPQELRADQRQLVLQPLAYALMCQGRREISRQHACQLLKAPLQLVSTTLTPEMFLDHLEAISSGLLLEREQDVYSFAHQTFQEYLAMIHIQEQHLEHELLLHIEESWWHETIRLFCAQTDATAILSACLSRSLLSLEALTLAIDCAEEARTVQGETKKRLYILLARGANDANPERRKIIVEALLKRRLRQMLPLQDATFVDTALVTCVEYELFLNEPHILDYIPDIWDQPAFSFGQGGSVLLGVRMADAKAFCNWLTARDREGYSYRLPRREERQQISVFVGARQLKDTAYWEEDGTIVWSHMGPSQSLLQQIFSHSAAANTWGVANPPELANALTSAGARDLASASKLASELSSNLSSTGSNTQNRVHDLASDLILLNELSKVRDNARELVNVLANVYPKDLASAGSLANFIARDLIRANRHAFANEITRALKIYAILFLIQRPKGIHPVYEGILLIKERMHDDPNASA